MHSVGAHLGHRPRDGHRVGPGHVGRDLREIEHDLGRIAGVRIRDGRVRFPAGDHLLGETVGHAVAFQDLRTFAEVLGR